MDRDRPGVRCSYHRALRPPCLGTNSWLNSQVGWNSRQAVEKREIGRCARLPTPRGLLRQSGRRSQPTAISAYWATCAGLQQRHMPPRSPSLHTSRLGADPALRSFTCSRLPLMDASAGRGRVAGQSLGNGGSPGRAWPASSPRVARTGSALPRPQLAVRWSPSASRQLRQPGAQPHVGAAADVRPSSWIQGIARSLGDCSEGEQPAFAAAERARRRR